ncbi:SCP2 sterol-binding domain-containing protein [Indioceanicola profundi]|uniref:SCP2 sterol-binding domain-containing protein n=1 Tax=Indioceanicola profundi TaxID=2220096 RepID=UPI000E6AD319|nr:SCP2 sterol-binding domain-containing protein [Indioceanicola profundi]
MSIDMIEQQMKSRSMQFAGLNAVVKFDFGQEGSLIVDGKTTPPAIGRTGPDPDTTLSISSGDFIKLSQGDLNPTMAFMTGKLKVSGNMGVAMKLSSMLED